MKKFYIAVFLILLFLPPVIWAGLFLADSDLYASLDRDLGEKRQKTQIENVTDLSLSGQAVTDFFSDRAPFRSYLITLKKNTDSLLEKPYEYDIRPAAMKLIYDTEDTRKMLAINTIAYAGLKNIYKPERIRSLINEPVEEKETSTGDIMNRYEVTEEVLPDCQNPGYRITLDNETGEYSEEELPATGHDWTVSSVIEPTYISYGYTEYICNSCGMTKKDDWVDKLIDTSYLAPNVHKDTTIGRFDWLFLHGWGNIPYYQAENILSVEEMNEYVDKLNTLQTLCNERNIKFAVIWAPSKDTIYPEYMPSFEVMDTYKRVPRLIDHIKANSSVRIAFPQKELKDITRYYESYYKYDSHWNFVGSFIGVQTMYSLLDMPTTDIMSLDITKESRPATGDLIELGGLNANDFPPFYEYIVHYKEQVNVTFESDEPVLINDTVYKTESDCGNDTRFVMIGDSYRNFMIPYIEKDFGHCTFIHREHTQDAIDDILSADILVLESAERYDHKSLNDMEFLIRLFSNR